MPEQRYEEILNKVKNDPQIIDWVKSVWRLILSGVYDYRNAVEVRGFCDAHSHLDRCFTFAPEFMPPGVNFNEIADYPLKAKQDFVGQLHKGVAYTEASLRERMKRQLERSVAIGTRELWAVVDTTPDIGKLAFNVAMELKREYAERIDLKVSCYPVFGFDQPDVNNERLKIVEDCAADADFIVGLPEKDDSADKVGFKGHTNILLDMGFRHRKPVHIHTDQENSAIQKDSFRVIECLEGLMPEELRWYTSGNPKLWLVHVISPSCYEAEEFYRLIDLIAKYNIGVICCPSAGISMRNLRSENAPVHNCVARVLEMLANGICVRVGTDNVCDPFVPSGTGLLIDELAILTNLIRHYTEHTFAKIGVGLKLNNADRVHIERSLFQTKKACERHAERLQRIENETKRDAGIRF